MADDAQAATAGEVLQQLPPLLPPSALSEFLSTMSAANSTPTEKSVKDARANAAALGGGGQVGLVANSLKNIINSCMSGAKYLGWSVQVGEGPSADKVAFIFAVGTAQQQQAAVQKKKVLSWCEDRKIWMATALSELGPPVRRSSLEPC